MGQARIEINLFIYYFTALIYPLTVHTLGYVCVGKVKFPHPEDPLSHVYLPYRCQPPARDH